MVLDGKFTTMILSVVPAARGRSSSRSGGRRPALLPAADFNAHIQAADADAVPPAAKHLRHGPRRLRDRPEQRTTGRPGIQEASLIPPLAQPVAEEPRMSEAIVRNKMPARRAGHIHSRDGVFLGAPDQFAVVAGPFA